MEPRLPDRDRLDFGLGLFGEEKGRGCAREVGGRVRDERDLELKVCYRCSQHQADLEFKNLNRRT